VCRNISFRLSTLRTLHYLYEVTLYEFNRLELNDSMEVVNQLGTFSDNHSAKKESWNLDVVDMFFVE
jgi:hypothetical protein